MDGTVALDAARARAMFDEQRGPLSSVEEFASGILRVVETNMERAIRVISVERGHDPRRFTLVAFGGGGPLHGCAVAKALKIPTVLVPALPGALSAVGILLADAVRDTSRTVMLPGSALSSPAALEAHFAAMEKQLRTEITTPDARVERSLDVRYRGQGYEITVPFSPSAAADFHALHQARFGFSEEARALEVVTLRVRLRAVAETWEPPRAEPRTGYSQQALRARTRSYFDGQWRADTRIFSRPLLVPGDRLRGPALIAEYTSTTVVPPDWKMEVDAFGNLVLEYSEEPIP
jgi:N-methylhydantoinase A